MLQEDVEQKERVLILGCSAAKRDVSDPVPAKDLYDGPAFRVLRRHLGAEEGVCPYVLSGRYGLIGVEQPVEPYDALLVPDEAFGRKVTAQIADLFGSACGEAVAVMSQRYFAPFQGWWRASGVEMRIRALEGPPGVRLALLRRWLGEGDESPQTIAESVRFRGQPVAFDRADAESIVAQTAALGKPAAWAVEVNGHLVSPKWLVARLTGVRAGEFHTHEALRVLRGIGLEPKETDA